jgi:Fe2+ transport system protein FeoA
LLQTEEVVLEKKLSELEPGERGVITKVEGIGTLRRRLLDMELVKDTKINVPRGAPLEDASKNYGYEN